MALHDLPLNSDRQLIERRFARPLGGEVVDAVGIIAAELHRLEDLTAHRCAKLPGKLRQQLVADAVAEEAGVGVGCVLAEPDPLLRYVLDNLVAPDAKQPAHERDAGVGWR